LLLGNSVAFSSFLILHELSGFRSDLFAILVLLVCCTLSLSVCTHTFREHVYHPNFRVNTLGTGLLNCLNARSRGLIQSEVRFL